MMQTSIGGARLRSARLVVAASLSLALALPGCRSARRAPAVRALFHMTSVGLESAGPSPTVLVYTTGGGRVGIGNETPRTLADTLRLSSLPSMTADVTDGEVHLELVGPGRLRVGGQVTGGPAKELAGEGRHIIVLRGGVGVQAR